MDRAQRAVAADHNSWRISLRDAVSSGDPRRRNDGDRSLLPIAGGQVEAALKGEHVAQWHLLPFAHRGEPATRAAQCVRSCRTTSSTAASSSAARPASARNSTCAAASCLLEHLVLQFLNVGADVPTRVQAPSLRLDLRRRSRPCRGRPRRRMLPSRNRSENSAFSPVANSGSSPR